MLKNLPLLGKISLGLGLFACGAILLTVTNLGYLNNIIMQSEQRELHAYAQDLQNHIQNQMHTGVMLAQSVAQQPPLQAAFAQRDRQLLSDILLPVFEQLQTEFGLAQFQFHTPPARSFLRLHMPERFGDDLSSFRATVVLTNQQQTPVTGLEVGVGGLGIRSVVPVFFRDQHQGSVEFGLNFGQVFFDQFSQQREIDAALHLFDGETRTTVAFTLVDHPLLDADDLLNVYDGYPLFKHLEFDDRNFAVYAIPVHDFSHQVIGVVELIQNRDYYISTLQQARNVSIAVVSVLLITGILINLTMARDLRQRVDRLIANMHDIAQGDLRVQIGKDHQLGGDEIGELARSVAAMRAQLHTLVANALRNSQSLNHSAQKIAMSIKDQAASSNQMSSSIVEITATMEQLTASATQVTEHAHALSTMSEHTHHSVEDGMAALQSIEQQMQVIEQDSATNLRDMQALGEKSQEIGKIGVLINKIAHQSKLIAFNAALEGVDAQGSGQRFMVVASEIRRLADHVAESAQEIEHKIDQIQCSIAHLATAITRNARAIELGRSAIYDTVQSFSPIVASAHDGSRSAQHIALSSQQQKIASNQVTVALTEIATASRYTSDAMTQIAEVTQNVSELAAELDREVQHFRLLNTKS